MAGGLGLKEVEVTTPNHRKRGVYVIDDDIDVRKSLHFLLNASDIVTWPFASATDFLEHLPSLEPAPILLDFRMPKINGLQMLEILNERAIHWPTIVITAHGDVPIAVRAIKLGAIDFLEKPFELEILDELLAQAFGMLEQNKHETSTRNEARQLIARLSKRESEVLTVLMQGLPNKIAAHRLGLSIRTVEMHRANALRKLKLKSIVEAALLMAAADDHQHHDVVPGQFD